MVTGTFSRSSSARFTPRSTSFNSPRFASAHQKWPLPSPTTVATTFVFSALACSLFLFGFRRVSIPDFAPAQPESCDVFVGSWVPYDGYPIYNGSKCPFAERGFNCLANGRTDTDYLRWRWKPNDCDVSRFDAREALRRLAGKRIVFVGDSISRTQWESLICMLMTGEVDKKSVYEVNGIQISKMIRYLGVRLARFNLTVEFFRSVFLVRQEPPRHGLKRLKSTLKLDKLDEINRRWVDSDVLIFNPGHWWTATKLFDML